MREEKRGEMLAPPLCPRCNTQRSFSILPDRMICRRCGHVIHRDTTPQSKPAVAAPETALERFLKDGTDQYGPREPVRATFGMQYPGPIDPWAQAAYSSGQTYVHRGEWELAVKAFYRAVDAQSDFWDAHYWIALLVKDPAVKREHLENVLAVRPNHVEAIRELMILDGRLSPDADVLNPHQGPMLREAGGAVATTSENLRCPRCGSHNLTVDEVTGLTICDSCNYVLEQAERSIGGDVLTMALLQRRAQPVVWEVGERLLSCDSCGAERTIPARKLSTHCPFCGSNHVFEQDALKSFQQPDGLISFAVTRKDAGERVKQQLNRFSERVKGWFNDNTIKRAELDGVYLPFWVFDVMAEVRRTTTQYQEYFRDSRSGMPDVYQTETFKEMVQDVEICAVKSPPVRLTERLGDYDLGAMRPYDPQLLARYPAEIYSTDFDSASLRARSVITRTFNEKYGTIAAAGSRVNVYSSVQQMYFQLVLMPVWVATLYEADGDVRAALINGQTGKVVLGRARKPISS